MKIKKLLLFALILTTVLFSSCSKKDDLATDDLTGTSWVTKNLGTTADPSYMMLKFTTKSIVESWYKEPSSGSPDFEKDMSGLYSISGNKVTVNFGSEGGTETGVIDGNSMTFTADGDLIVFTRQ